MAGKKKKRVSKAGLPSLVFEEEEGWGQWLVLPGSGNPASGKHL